MLKKFSNYFIVICVVFTILTLTSSTFYLIKGETHDTHFHLINRFVISSIGIGSILLYDLLKKWPPKLSLPTHYISTMMIVFLYVWFTGFFDELHPNAYRDVFFNFTGVYILISIILIISSMYKNKKNKLNE